MLGPIPTYRLECCAAEATHCVQSNLGSMLCICVFASLAWAVHLPTQQRRQVIAVNASDSEQTGVLLPSNFFLNLGRRAAVWVTQNRLFLHTAVRLWDRVMQRSKNEKKLGHISNEEKEIISWISINFKLSERKSWFRYFFGNAMLKLVNRTRSRVTIRAKYAINFASG